MGGWQCGYDVGTSLIDRDKFYVTKQRAAHIHTCTTILEFGLRLPYDSIVHHAWIDRLIAWGRYEGAINFAGCGNTIADNELWNAPHTAITGSGNNFMFSNNSVHDVCRGTADSGAFYVGRTWASLGNTLQGNNFSHIGNVEEMAQHTQTAAIYLDDDDSGWLVQGESNNGLCFPRHSEL